MFYVFEKQSKNLTKLENASETTLLITIKKELKAAISPQLTTNKVSQFFRSNHNSSVSHLFYNLENGET